MSCSPELKAEVLRLYLAEKWKRGTIAAQLGLSYGKVYRMLRSHGIPVKKQKHPGALKKYSEFLSSTLAQYPTLRATRLYDMLKTRGYNGSLRTVRRAVKLHRPVAKSEVFVRVETLPGEQAQVDWAQVGRLKVDGTERPLWVFVMVLSYSRALWAELVLELDIHSLRRSLVRASHYFGGSPRQWLFDNPKTVTLQRSGSAVQFHPRLLDLAAQMFVQPRVCGVRKPHEKGKVERAIRFLKDRFFAARPLHSIAHGNTQLLSFFNEVADVRTHPYQREKTVADCFAEEKSTLLALPNPLPETGETVLLVVDKTASVHFDKNRYSVPPKHVGNTLTVVADDDVVRILDGAEQVACHTRCYGKHKRVEDPQHIAQILQTKERAQPLKGRELLCTHIPAMKALFTQWVEQGLNVGSMTSKTIRYLDLYGVATLKVVIDEMLRRKVTDIGALAILCEQYKKQRSAPSLALPFGKHVVERDVVAHDLGGYDDGPL
ncbi:MAG: IS21 family transposase [Polyangiaceae bacterium]|nr:IS21 family transposase [Polyangiaceae bacterium]